MATMAKGALARTGPTGVAAEALHQVKFDFGVTGLALRQSFKLSYEEWEACGVWLRAVDRAVQWWVGDWMRLGEEQFGEEHAQALELGGGWDERTLQNMRWVAERVARSVRRADLSWAHHREVAALESADDQRDWLARAAEGEDGQPWTSDRLRREMRASEHGTDATLWVVIEARSREDADQLRAQYEAEGRKVKVR